MIITLKNVRWLKSKCLFKNYVQKWPLKWQFENGRKNSLWFKSKWPLNLKTNHWWPVGFIGIRNSFHILIYIWNASSSKIHNIKKVRFYMEWQYSIMTKFHDGNLWKSLLNDIGWQQSYHMIHMIDTFSICTFHMSFGRQLLSSIGRQSVGK